MKQLTIEHLAPYLLYGLKGYCQGIDKKVFTVTGLDANSDKRQWIYAVEGLEDYETVMSDFIPILHRPSVNQKEIENAILSADDKNTWHLYQEVADCGFFMEYQENLRNGDNTGCNLHQYLKLFEMKIDVFGLIDDKLAVDVNNLENNPYK